MGRVRGEGPQLGQLEEEPVLAKEGARTELLGVRHVAVHGVGKSHTT